MAEPSLPTPKESEKFTLGETPKKTTPDAPSGAPAAPSGFFSGIRERHQDREEEKADAPSGFFSGIRERYQAREEAEAAQQKRLNDLRVQMPNRKRRDELTERARGLAGEQQQALTNILNKKGVPLSEETYQQALRDTIIRTVRPPEDWKGMDDDEWGVLKVYSMRELGKEYESKKEAEEKFADDFIEYNRMFRAMQDQAKDRGIKRTLVGTVNGEEVGRAERTDTGLDDQFADVLPSSANQLLFTDTSDQQILAHISHGLTQVPTDDERLELVFDNTVDRKDFKQSAFAPRKEALAMDTYVPLFTDPTRGRFSLDLGRAKLALESYYFNEIAAQRKLSTADIRGDEALEEQIRDKARDLAKRDIARVSKHTQAYVYDKDPDEGLRDFLEGKGVLGNLGRITLLRPLLATMLAPRQTTGKVFRKGEEGEYVIEPGAAVEILGDSGITSAADYFMRLWSTTEAAGAAFHLAHKDYLREHGEEPVGRGQDIIARMAGLWGSDRHVVEITSTTDSEGRLYSEAGSVLLNEFGESHPYVSAALVGLPTFVASILQPDAFFVLGAGVGKAGKLAGKAGTGVAKLIRFRQIDILQDAKGLLRTELAKLSPDELSDPLKIQEAINSAQALDETGAVDLLIRTAATDAGMTANVGDDYRKVLKTLHETYTHQAQMAKKRTAAALKSAKKAEADAVKMGTKRQPALSLGEAAKNILEANSAQLTAARTAEAAAETRIKQIKAEILANNAGMLFISKKLPALLRPGLDEKGAKALRKMLGSKKLQNFFASRGMSADALRAELDALYPQGRAVAASAATRAQKSALLGKLNALLGSNLVDGLTRRGTRLKAARKTAEGAYKAIITNNQTLVDGVQQALGSTVKDLVKLTKKLRGAKAVAVGTKDAKSATELGNLADQIDASLADLTDGIKALRDKKADFDADATLHTRMGADIPNVIKRTADNFMTRLNGTLDALDILETARGRAFLEDITRKGKSIEELTADQDLLDAARGFTPSALDALSDEDFLRALTSVEFARIMWRSPKRFRQWGKKRTILSLEAMRNTRVWTAYIAVHVKEAFELFPIFKTNLRLLDVAVRKDLDDVAKQMSHRVNRVMENLNTIAINVPDPDNLAQEVIRFLTTTEQQIIKTPGMKRSLTIDGTVGLENSLTREAFNAYYGIARAYRTRDVLVENRALDASIKAFIMDKAPIEAVSGAGYDRILKGVLDAIYDKHSLLASMSDRDLLAALQKTIYTVVKKERVAVPGRKFVGSAADKYTRSQNLFHKSLILGASESIYTKRLFNIIGPRFGDATVGRAMNYFMLEGAARETLGLRPFRATVMDQAGNVIQQGDMVVLKSDVDAFNRIMNRPIGADKRPGATVAGRKLREEQSLVRQRYQVKGVRPEAVDRTKRLAAVEDALFDANLGAPARRINKIETVEDVEWAILDDGTRIKSSELSMRDPRLSMLDVFDGFLKWGPEMVETIGRASVKEGTTAARKTYSRFVAHAVDESGNVRMIPRDALVIFHKQLDNIEKELTERISQQAMTNPITRAIPTTLSKIIQWWKSHVLFGLVIPRPAYFFNQVVGDFTQMALTRGFVEATQLSFFGALGYLPGGKTWQNALVQVGKRMPGVPLPPLMGAMFNKQLDKILAGGSDIIVLKNGKKMRADTFLAEAIEAGINENIRVTDFAQIIDDMAKKNFHRVKNGMAARRITKPEQIYRDYRNIMEYTAREANRRQRLLLFSHLRINKGLSVADAKKGLDNALYDWTHSISRYEANTFAWISAFYVFTKNAFAQTFRGLFDGTSDSTRTYMSRWIRGNTQQQRLKSMIQAQDILLKGQYIPPGQTLTPEEMYEKGTERRMPDYLSEYPLLSMGTLSPTAEDIFKDTGVLKLNYARSLPKLTSVEFANTYAALGNFILGAFAAASSADKDLDWEKAFERASEEVVDMMNPLSSGVAENYLRGLQGSAKKSDYGPRIGQDDLELLMFMGMGDSITEDADGALRLDGYANNLFLATVLHPYKNESTRVKLLWTLLFPDTEMTPTSIKALRAEGFSPRLEALAQLTNIGKIYFYHGANAGHYEVEEVKKRLRLDENHLKKSIRSPIKSE